MLLTEEDIQKFNSQSNNKEINDISDLVLVHVTDYLPKDGIIRTPKSAGATLNASFYGKEFKVARERETIHFCVNGCVSSHEFGNFDAKYAIIIPLKNINKEKIEDGCLVDIFAKDDFEIPAGSYFMYPSDEKIDAIGENLEFIQYKKSEATPVVNDYVSTVLSQLGYSVQSIGKDDWGNSLRSAEAKEIIRNSGINFTDVLHSYSKYRENELAFEANNFTQQIIKLLMSFGIDSFSQNDNTNMLEDIIYSIPSGIFRTSRLDYSNKEYVDDLYRKLEEIGLVIPNSVKQEVEQISNGAARVVKEELESLNPNNSYEKQEEIERHLPGLILKRRIIGEVKLNEILQSINGSSNYIDLLEAFNNDLFNYITKDRKIEFVKELGINLTNDEMEIFTNRELLKQYLYIYKLKDINYSELDLENKQIVDTIKQYFLRCNKCSDNFRISSDFIGEKEYASIINPQTMNFSLEELQKISTEIIEDRTPQILLNFGLDIANNESLFHFLETYNNYSNKVVQTLGDEKIKYDNSYEPNIVLDTLFQQYIFNKVKMNENERQQSSALSSDEIGRTR